MATNQEMKRLSETTRLSDISRKDTRVQVEQRVGKTKIGGQAEGIQMGMEALIGELRRNFPDGTEFGLWNLFHEQIPSSPSWMQGFAMAGIGSCVLLHLSSSSYTVIAFSLSFRV